MTLKLFLAASFILIPIITFAQTDQTIWKELDTKNNDNIFYDSEMLDTAHGLKFDVWVMQKYDPPLKFDYINGKIYKSKTLYSIDSNKQKYGIWEVIYFDQEDKQIYNHINDNNNLELDKKYGFPISKYSFINQLLQLYIDKKGE